MNYLPDTGEWTSFQAMHPSNCDPLSIHPYQVNNLNIV